MKHQPPSWQAFWRIVRTLIPLARAIYPVIPRWCCSQLWEHWFIYKQSTHTHYAAPPLWSPQRNSMNSCLADRETRLWARGGPWERDILYIVETANRQTDLIPGRAVSQQHHSSLCMSNTYPADSQGWLLVTPQLVTSLHQDLIFTMRTVSKAENYTIIWRCWITKVSRAELWGSSFAGCDNQHGNSDFLCWKGRKSRGLAACVILWLCGSKYSGK